MTKFAIISFLAFFCLMMLFGGIEAKAASPSSSGPEINVLMNDVAGKGGYETAGMSTKALYKSVGTVIKAALGMAGTIFLILTIYAGILWMTAQGKDEQVEKATKIIRTAVIGLIIVMSAYAITYFVTARLEVIGNLGSGTGDSEIPK